MPSKKPEKSKPRPKRMPAQPARRPLKRIVRWATTKKKDVRGPWAYGMVVGERGSDLDVQVLDFAWRNAWDLTTIHLHTSTVVYEMDGRHGLHDLVTLTLDGRADGGDKMPGTEEGYVDDTDEGLRPLDRLSEETIEQLTRRYKRFCWLAIHQIWGARNAANEGKPGLLKRRQARFFRTILPIAAETNLAWWEIISLQYETSGRSLSAFEKATGYPEAEEALLARVYWPLLSDFQAQRARYHDLDENPDTRISKQSDNLARGVKRLYRSHGRTSEQVRTIHPETWEEAIWQRLQPRFGSLSRPMRLRLLREHWGQPYFPRLVQAFLTVLSTSSDEEKAQTALATDIKKVLDERMALVAPKGFLEQLTQVLPAFKAP